MVLRIWHVPVDGKAQHRPPPGRARELSSPVVAAAGSACRAAPPLALDPYRQSNRSSFYDVVGWDACVSISLSLPAEFEIPDEWWAEAGMTGFVPSGPAYHSTAAATHVVRLRDMEPPFRFPEHPLDWRGFSHVRLVSILRGIAAGIEIEPVSLVELPPSDVPPAPFRYRVRNGLHRFYASIAAGFDHLPLPWSHKSVPCYRRTGGGCRRR